MKVQFLLVSCFYHLIKNNVITCCQMFVVNDSLNLFDFFMKPYCIFFTLLALSIYPNSSYLFWKCSVHFIISNRLFWCTNNILYIAFCLKLDPLIWFAIKRRVSLRNVTRNGSGPVVDWYDGMINMCGVVRWRLIILGK